MVMLWLAHWFQLHDYEPKLILVHNFGEKLIWNEKMQKVVKNYTKMWHKQVVSLPDPAYYNRDGLNGSKDISLSSLRRKLFTQVENNVAEKEQLGVPTNIK